MLLSSLLGSGKSFVPTSLSGCVLWLRADLGVTSSTTFTWADQSGTGDVNKNCTSTGTARPTANGNNSSYNHQATIDFTTGGTHLKSGVWSSALAQPFTMFVVGHNPNSTTNQYVISDLPGAIGIYAGPSYAPTIFGNVGSDISTGSWQTPGVLGVVGNGSSSAMYFNHASASTATGNFGTNGFPSTDVGDYAGGGGSFDWGHNAAASVAEIIMYNSALSAGNLTTVMKYLGARYGITIS